jgi:hypothetical protein
MKKKNFKNEMFFLTFNQKNDKIDFTINCQTSFPSLVYGREFSLNDLQKISKYFNLFDSIDECFADFKLKFDDNNYEMILNDINSKITLKIKTNVANKDFNLDIPIKKPEQEKIYCKFIFPNSNNKYNYYNDNESLSIKLIDKIDKYLDKKMTIFTNNMYPKIDESGSESDSEKENKRIKKMKTKKIFEKSTIIENDFEKRLLISFIKENDKTKTEIFPVLLFKSSVDGDSSQKFHEKCDFNGATLTLVRSETGRRFGGYTSISWDKNIGDYNAKGDNFIFSLDARKYHKR